MPVARRQAAGLQRLQQAQGFFSGAADVAAVDGDRLDHAFRIDDKGCAMGEAFRCQYAATLRQFTREIADQRESQFAQAMFGPGFVAMH